MKKELLLISGLLLGATVKSIENVPAGDCTATVITTSIALGGITIPRLPNGDSIIFLRDRGMLKHELGHGDQICELGGIVFLKEYLNNPTFFENDADRRVKDKL